MRLGAYPAFWRKAAFARGLRQGADQRAAPPPLRIQPRVRGDSRRHGLRMTGRNSRTAPTSRSASCPTIPGISAASSIPSSNPSRWSRTRCSAPSSAPLRAPPDAACEARAVQVEKHGELTTPAGEIRSAAARRSPSSPARASSKAKHVHFWPRESGASPARSFSRPPSTRPTAAASTRTAAPAWSKGCAFSPASKSRRLRHPHRHSRAGQAACRRGRRHPANPRLPVPPDRFARGAGRTGRIVNLKKGQFVWPRRTCAWPPRKWPPRATSGSADRARRTCFGYNNLVVDMRSLVILRKLGIPGHLRRHAQRAASGRGRWRLRRPGRIHRAAGARRVAVGVDGLFVEVHEAPERALSDGPNALRLDRPQGLQQHRPPHVLLRPDPRHPRELGSRTRHRPKPRNQIALLAASGRVQQRPVHPGWNLGHMISGDGAGRNFAGLGFWRVAQSGRKPEPMGVLP
jgi:hypothetical protein